MIRMSPIRLVGPDNEQIGVVETPDAIRMAEERGLDLVEIVPDNRPPICKIMDYGQYRYELSKKPKQSGNKGNETKEIRLGRSVKIDPHDVKIRVEQARRFLMQGSRVQVIQRFKGREMQHKELGLENLQRFVDELGEIVRIEIPPRWVGKQAVLLLAPERDRIKALKQKMEQLAKNEEARKKAEEEERKHQAELAALEARDASEAQDDDDDDAVAESAKQQKPKKKESRKVSNPVEDEIADLLGG